MNIYFKLHFKMYYIPHLRNPAIWLVEIAVMVLAIPVNKRKMPRPRNSSRVKFKLPGIVQSCLKTGLSDRGYHTCTCAKNWSLDSKNTKGRPFVNELVLLSAVDLGLDLFLSRFQ